MSDDASLLWSENGLSPLVSTGRVTAASRDEDRPRQEQFDKEEQREAGANATDDAAKNARRDVVDTLTLSAAAQKLLAAVPPDVTETTTVSDAARSSRSLQDHVLLSTREDRPQGFVARQI